MDWEDGRAIGGITPLLTTPSSSWAPSGKSLELPESQGGRQGRCCVREERPHHRGWIRLSIQACPRLSRPWQARLLIPLYQGRTPVASDQHLRHTVSLILPARCVQPPLKDWRRALWTLRSMGQASLSRFGMGKGTRWTTSPHPHSRCLGGN